MHTGLHADRLCKDIFTLFTAAAAAAAAQSQSSPATLASPSAATDLPFSVTSSLSFSGSIPSKHIAVTASSAAMSDVGITPSNNDEDDDGEEELEAKHDEQTTSLHPVTIDDVQNLQQMDDGALELVASGQTTVAELVSASTDSQTTRGVGYPTSVPPSITGTGGGNGGKSPSSSTKSRNGGGSKTKRQPDVGSIGIKPYFEAPVAGDKRQSTERRYAKYEQSLTRCWL